MIKQVTICQNLIVPVVGLNGIKGKRTPIEVIPAGGLIRKPATELLHIPGVINACHGPRESFHNSRYYISGYLRQVDSPLLLNSKV